MLKASIIRVHKIPCPLCGHYHYTEERIAGGEFFSCKNCNQRIHYTHVTKIAATCRKNNHAYRNKDRVKASCGESYYVDIDNMKGDVNGRINQQRLHRLSKV